MSFFFFHSFLLFLLTTNLPLIKVNWKKRRRRNAIMSPEQYTKPGTAHHDPSPPITAPITTPLPLPRDGGAFVSIPLPPHAAPFNFPGEEGLRRGGCFSIDDGHGGGPSYINNKYIYYLNHVLKMKVKIFSAKWSGQRWGTVGNGNQRPLPKSVYGCI
jgi:hypothetical protein